MFESQRAEQPQEVEGDDATGGVFLSWRGRKRSKILVPLPRLLETIDQESDPTDEDPGNLIIEGDNKQAMSSLRYLFADQVDVVIIDPPYNTGKDDFRYSDRRYEDPDAEESLGAYVSGTAKSRHTKWLNEMAPTLRLIHELMSPSGLIFVHINDVELPRLLLLLEDVFQEENHVGTLIWHGVTDNNPSRIVVEHEYIVVFAKDIERVPKEWASTESEIVDEIVRQAEGIAGSEPDLAKAEVKLRAALAEQKDRLGNFARYYRLDEHWRERGPHAAIRNTDNPGRPGYFYDVIHPNGKVVAKPGTGYRFPPDRMEQLRLEDRLVFGKDETKLVEIKRYVKEITYPLRSIINLDARAGANTIAALFGRRQGEFRNPKPVELEEMLLSFAARNQSALILDCFAGSGTTGHAVMRLNKRDGGRRRFILVERGEEGDAYATSLTAERIRRARKVEGLPGGFTFKRIGPRIDQEGLLSMERSLVAEAILMADATGRGGGIRPVKGDLVIGRNRRGEAICLSAGIHSDKAVDGAELRAMLEETERQGLKTPMRIYGVSCEVYEDELFNFLQLPDEIMRNLYSGRGMTR